jgi:formylglycine-generating enzyme required for sulfatase activity
MRISLIVAVLFLSTLPGFSWAEEGKPPLSLDNIQYLLQERVSPGRVATLIDEYGVSFEATAEILEQLGNDVPKLKRAITRASQLFVRRQQIETDSLALEAEKQNLEEARRKEAQRKKAEEEKRLRAEAEAKKKAKEQKTAAAVKTKPGMVKIPAGKFWMGCNEKVDTQCLDREKPGRTVSVDAFQIDTTEVTVKAYRSCVESGKCSDKGLTTYNSCNWDKPGRDDHPVNCVTWNQARTYCEAVGKRLPTEAEWEKAARGEKDWTYPWGNEWDKTKANTEEGGKGGTVAVGSYDLGVSPDGVHDMAGNVLEWVQDWYAADYYQKGPDRKPTGPNSGKQRSVRGGSWAYGQRAARVAYRLRLTSGDIYGFIGFRCASS